MGGGAMGGGGGGFCWVAREVYGETNPRWRLFRAWLLTEAPAWLREAYRAHGEQFAAWIHDKPVVKAVLRQFMDQAIDSRPAGGR
jgi:predicted phosphoadenosine phosphosulfate sulfurtransferase